MGTTPEPCSFCSRPSAFGPFTGVFVCQECSTLIGDVAWEDQASGVSNIWVVTGPASRPDLADKPPPQPIDVEESSRSFEAALASGISGYDAMPHADLAHAYAEMGLASDALRKAAIVLDRKTSVSPSAARVALGVVLAPSLLKAGGLERLSGRVKSRGSGRI
jgi:hypothetical protein